MYRLTMGVGGWIYFVGDDGDVPTIYTDGQSDTCTIVQVPVAWECVELYGT